MIRVCDWAMSEAVVYYMHPTVLGRHLHCRHQGVSSAECSAREITVVNAYSAGRREVMKEQARYILLCLLQTYSSVLRWIQ